MKRPKQVDGYDVLIWSRGRMRQIFCSGYTPAGEAFIKSLDPKADGFLELVCTPEEFLEQMPPSLSVGMINPQTKKVFPVPRNSLQ